MITFLHGLGQTPSSWKWTIQEMAEETQCLDLMGMCQNQALTYPNLYREFQLSMEKEKEPIHLCGLSLGAILALHYAIDHPDRVQSLVLIAPQYKMPKRMLTFQNMVYHCMPKRMFSSMGFTKKEMIALTCSMKALDFTNQLRHVKCHTLVLCGSKDRVNLKATKRLSERIKQSTWMEVQGAGHEVNKDQPKQLAKIMTRFYQKEIYK